MSKTAVVEGELGAWLVQLASVFQSPEEEPFQVWLCAEAMEDKTQKAAERKMRLESEKVLNFIVPILPDRLKFNPFPGGKK